MVVGCKIDMDSIVEESMMTMGGNNDGAYCYYSMSTLGSGLVLIQSA